ncbi:CoA pyrophosphatase [bacterium]|jgi:8-oxo-dGTP pyrophosphatase MutT (NUDIX family)|nr:CoA pyrophosphatase [bacterium]
MNLTVDKIKSLLTKPLPGLQSHLKMAPPTRKTQLEAAKEAMQFANKSAVMILLFHEHDKLKVVFIRRSFYVGIHAGQMAFPGGRFEDSDETVEQTAFREIEEEIGVRRDKIELLGRISDIYVPPSNFLISVFVGYLSEKPVYKPDEREVAEVIEVDFDEFLQPENIDIKSFHVPSANHAITAPYYQTTHCDIWGASAMVVSELVDMLQNVGS